MKITFLGHSGFVLETEKTIVVDPFLTGNPKAGMKAQDVKKADIILVTHSHPDHLGDAREIAKRTNAVLVGVHEIAVSDEVTGEGMNIGGTIEVKGVPITMVKAEHSTGIGDAAGFIWKQDGRTLYHMGDTGLFSDIKLIADLYKPDIAFVPIGDRYTMNPEQAALATQWINPKWVVPMHYGTFPFLVQSPKDFEERVGKSCAAQILILKPGETLDV
jgi:L-ascorbate metabolism protein UlaG (beta-lactamase superfamily)